MKGYWDKESKFLKESNKIECVYDDDSYAQAKEAWEFLKGKNRLTISIVLKVHKILMLNQDIFSSEKGYFRKRQVWVGRRACLAYPQILNAMHQWVKQANKDKTWDEIKKSHIIYETIHPFIDGNGRTGRLFMNWARVKNNLGIKIIYNKYKHLYYKWFEGVR